MALLYACRSARHRVLERRQSGLERGCTLTAQGQIRWGIVRTAAVCPLGRETCRYYD